MTSISDNDENDSNDNNDGKYLSKKEKESQGYCFKIRSHSSNLNSKILNIFPLNEMLTIIATSQNVFEVSEQCHYLRKRHQFSRSVVSNSLWLHALQHARLLCPSPTPGACSNSCPSNRWCHPTISSSVIPFSSCLQSFPAPGSLPMSHFFESGGQSIGVSASASVLPMNFQD